MKKSKSFRDLECLLSKDVRFSFPFTIGLAVNGSKGEIEASPMFHCRVLAE